MNGHLPIIAMRRSGLKPASVWVNDYPCITADYTVKIDENDLPESLDLRFLIGTMVIATSDKPAKLDRIVKACKEAKAARVIANLYEDVSRFGPELVSVTDSEGVLTWQK